MTEPPEKAGIAALESDMSGMVAVVTKLQNNVADLAARVASLEQQFYRQRGYRNGYLEALRMRVAALEEASDAE